MTDSEPQEWAPRTDRLFDKDRDEEIRTHLTEAHNHTIAAQELLYGAGRQYRGFWYQVRLGKAQNVLIRLLKKELKRKKAS